MISSEFDRHMSSEYEGQIQTYIERVEKEIKDHNIVDGCYREMMKN